MKGSHKFWSMIAVIILIFLNYLTWFTDYIPRGNIRLTGFQFWTFVATCLVDITFIFLFGIVFCTQVLPKFNNWLDEKF